MEDPGDVPNRGDAVAADAESTKSASTISGDPKQPLPKSAFATTAVAPPDSAVASLQFPGFELLAELGRGGMGVVYKARDLRTDRVVALKTLQGFDAAALYRFKREFRALSDVVHPNLIALYELSGEGQQWCFTMEFVDGVSFLRYLQPTGEIGTGSITNGRLVRLHNAFRQLADALSALHGAGLLHRDIKPSNVLVTKEGRVVLLDFGLVTELSRDGVHQSTEYKILGTVAYMSPEQAAGQSVTRASDWYSFGVMLFEALTGRLPFAGSVVKILQDKQSADPPDLPLGAGIPEQLRRLCRRLLARHPSDRPNTTEIVDCFADAEIRGQPPQPTIVRSLETPELVGRQTHLAELTSAFETVKEGRPVVVSICGNSGAGKSTLSRFFLEDLAKRQDAVVLTGRCYQYEAMPYKALDAIVDALSTYLRSLPPLEAKALLPRDVATLAKMFPILRRVDVIAAFQRSHEIADPQEIRRRAFAALRELLARLGDSRPLVLYIDDVQWADRDSADLLASLLQPPDSPLMLTIVSYRIEDEEKSRFLRAWSQLGRSLNSALDWRLLPVKILSEIEARSLAEGLLSAAGCVGSEFSDVIAVESGGNPFFVQELVQCVVNQGVRVSADKLRDLTLENVLWERFENLPDTERRLLSTLAVAGCPLPRRIALAIADIHDDDSSIVNRLKNARLLRVVGSTEHEDLETFHDRVRETIVARLPVDSSARFHLSIADALERSEDADPEQLATHFSAAGDFKRAGKFYVVAGDQAAEKLAFDRSAKFLQSALEQGTYDLAEERSIRTRFGEALANAGRGREAAAQYQMAARTAPVDESFDLRHRAATQLLISGQLDDGVRELRAVLRSAKVRMPTTPTRTLVFILCHELRLRLRGLKFRIRAADEVSQLDLRRIDLCWSATIGLMGIDVIYGAYFHLLGLRLALAAGEPFRIARTLTLQAMNLSSANGNNYKRSDEVLSEAEELSGRLEDPYLKGIIAMSRACAALIQGRFALARSCGELGEPILQKEGKGFAWELDTLRVFYLQSLTYLGDMATLQTRWPQLIQDARARGNRYAEMNLSTDVMAMVRLCEDQPDKALAELERARNSWSYSGHHVQHHNALLAHSYIQLYKGDGRAAWEFIDRALPACKASKILFVQQIRMDVFQLRARSVLAIAAAGNPDQQLLKQAARDAKRLADERIPWGTAISNSIFAGIEVHQGRPASARELLQLAASQLDQVDMRLFAAACRRRLGRLLGDRGGEAMVLEADAWMKSQGIKDPARMAAMFVP